MSAYTPGPWAVLDGFPTEIVPEAHRHRSCGASIYEAEDRDRYALRIATADLNTLSGFAHEIPREQAKANARLIAAAPKLLSALEEITDHLAGVMGGPIMSQFVEFKNGVEGIPTIKAARAAIAEAKGESDDR